MPADSAAKDVPLKTRLIASAIIVIIKALSFTYRVRISGRRELLLRLPDYDDCVILAAWHNRMFYLGSFIYRYLLKGKFKMAVLSSDSKDGEIGATIGRKSGLYVARGSSSRGGSAGMRSLYRAIVKEKHSIIILPDASKGPVYKAKIGVVALAKMTGKPIVPLSVWSNRQWRIRSWDRMIIPKPFARVEVVVGDELIVSREAAEAEIEARRLEVQATLDELGERAQDPFRKSACSP